MRAILTTMIQLCVVIGIAPFATGFVRWCTACLQGRAGASPFLPYIALATMFRKEFVVSRSTSWIFRLAPLIVCGTMFALAAILPLTTTASMFGGRDHFVVVASLLALGAVFLVLGALDSGSAFGGMGSSRAMTIAALTEPALMTVFAGFAVASGSGSLRDMLTAGGYGLILHPGLLLSVLAFLLVLLAENARYPVDNPATHLELTMVHEALMLEYSGPPLALLELAASLKLTMFALLLANLIVPQWLLGAGDGLAPLPMVLLATIGKLMIVMAGLALLESSIPKMRFYRMQEYLSTAFVIALAGLVLTLVRFV